MMPASQTRISCCLAIASLVVLVTWMLWPVSDSTKQTAGDTPGRSLANPPIVETAEALGTAMQKTIRGATETRPSKPLTDQEIEALGQQLRASNDAHVKRQVFEALMAGMTPENAAKTQKQIEHFSPHSPESRAFYRAWGRLSGEPVMAVAAWASKQSAQAALSGWASASPVAARKYFETLQKNSHNGDGSTNHLSREYLGVGLADGLAMADPDMATDFVQEQFDRKEVGDKKAGDMIRAVADRVLQQKGFEEAASWALTVSDDLRSEAIAGIARKYAAVDVATTLDWLTALGDEHHQGAAYFHTFSTWMREDPAAAGEYLAAMPDSYRRNEAIIAIALQTTDGDWASPLELVETIPEPATRNRGFSDMFNTWARDDAIAASEYLAQMPPSPERDHAISGFAGSLVVRDPATAIAWADQIGDNHLRESSLVTVALSFFENDPAAASAWLPDSGLPVETVDRILNPSAEDQHRLNFLTQQ